MRQIVLFALLRSSSALILPRQSASNKHVGYRLRGVSIHVLKGKSSPESASEAAARRGERKGFYVRPSLAIEKGGGFFIPGLEGSRLRVAISCLVLLLLGLNRFPGYDASAPQVRSELIAGAAAILLLVQSLSQANSGKAKERTIDSAVSSPARVSYLAPDSSVESLWAANALLDLTRASSAILLEQREKSYFVSAAVGNYEDNPQFGEKTIDLPASALASTESIVTRGRLEFAQVFDLTPDPTRAALIKPILSSALVWVVSSRDGYDLSTKDQRDWVTAISAFTEL